MMVGVAMEGVVIVCVVMEGVVICCDGGCCDML